MLRDAGHAVTGLDVAPGPETQIVGSVADRAVVDRAFSCGIEAVIHAGALHKPDIARYPTQSFIDTNITGTLNLLNAALCARHDRFIYTSTTSVMINQAIRDETSDVAVWLDETACPLHPRNIYGITKLAAEGLCRLYSIQHAMNCMVLRTSRFFPEDDDTHRTLSGENQKANEFLYRRLTVEDAAQAHILALDRAGALGSDTFVLSAPTPFKPEDVRDLKRDAANVIARYFPDAPHLYARQGWKLPKSIGRVYDAGMPRSDLDFEAKLTLAACCQRLEMDRGCHLLMIRATHPLRRLLSARGTG